MDSFLKRKNGFSVNDNGKRLKKEVCPHSVKCYRKNPHHFKEFDHPHLLKLVEMDSPVEIPSDFPQPKDVYLEQLEMLKSLLKITDKKPPISANTSSPSPSSSSAVSNGKRIAHRGSQQRSPENSDTKIKSEPTWKGKNIVPRKNKFEENDDEIVYIDTKHGTMLEKLERAAPYNLFFTTIIKAPQTQDQPNAVFFTDLLCPSLGALKCSLQINFMIDIDWLGRQYKARNLRSKPLTILYGEEFPGMTEFIKQFCPNITSKFIKMKDPFGCHHSKVGIYVYEDNSLRVVVSTANLYREDWKLYNQGLWVSPACRRLPDPSSEKDGESPTKFKANLINYLKTYNEPSLKPFIEYVQKADFSAVRVFLTYSSPGKHYAQENGSHLHAVADLLSKHCVLPVKTTPQSEGPLAWGIIAQASSIGSMGKKPSEWLRGSLLRCLASYKGCPKPMNSSASISIVYPTVDNVMTGYFKHESGGCLPYSRTTHEKQRWLENYMHQWKAEAYGRTRAMPHIKTYCRISPCLSKLAYFLITSANMSKSAWGGPFAKDMGVYVRSYEVGVLFLPQFFAEEYFEISDTADRKNQKLFPFMYDVPLTSYKKDDYPWCN